MMYRTTILTLLLLAAAGCRSDRCNTPFGLVEPVNINDPEFAELSNVGGSLILNRGYKGVVVTRTSYDDFEAFDCACPNDNEVALQPDAEWGNSILVCPSCGSRYNALDGSPLDGAVSGCQLYHYNTTFDGYTLSIY